MLTLFPQAVKHSSIPVLVFILAAEGWVVAASMARQANSVVVSWPLDAETRTVSDDKDGALVPISADIAAFFNSAAGEQEREWIRSIMRVYFEEYRAKYLTDQENAAAPPFLKPVGPPAPQQELNALSRFIEDHGRRMLDAYRRGAAPSGVWPTGNPITRKRQEAFACLPSAGGIDGRYSSGEVVT